MFLKRPSSYFLIITFFCTAHFLNGKNWDNPSVNHISKNWGNRPVIYVAGSITNSIIGSITGSGSDGGVSVQVTQRQSTIKRPAVTQATQQPIQSIQTTQATQNSPQLEQRAHPQKQMDDILASEYVQRSIRQDPLWGKTDYEMRENPNFQKLLLIRLDHVERLGGALGLDRNCPAYIKDFLYGIVDRTDLNFFNKEITEAMTSPNPQEGYRKACNKANQRLFTNFLGELSSDFVGHSASVKNFFVHPSGILKAFIEDDYTKEHFVSRGIQNQHLLFYINYASIFKNSGSPGVHKRAFEALRCAEHLLDFYDSGIDDEVMQVYHEEQFIIATKDILAGNLSPELDKQPDQNYTDLEINPHREERVAAFERAKAEGFVEYKKTSELTPEVKGFMEAFNINQMLFKTVTGNGLQHHITSELIGIMSHSLDLGVEIVKHAADFIDLAQNYNRLQRLEESMVATDISYGLSDYAQAVALGFKDFGSDLVDLIAHPAKHIYDIGAGVGTLVKKVSRYLYNRKFKPLVAKGSEDRMKQMMVGLMYQALDSPGPEKARFGTKLLADHFLTGKAMSAISRLAVSSATIVADVAEVPFFNLVEKVSQKKEYLQTSVGRVATRYLRDGEVIVGKVKDSSISVLAVAKKTLPCLDKIKREVVLLAKEFGSTTKHFLGRKMAVTIHFNHIFLPEFPFKTTLKNLRINGWHHDFKNMIEKFKGLKLLNKKYKSGCLIADIEWMGKKPFRKTFFPSSWTREKVALKVREAWKKAKVFQKNNGKYCATGKTSEGIVVKFHVNIDKFKNTIDITSAFPCEDWLLSSLS